MLKSDSWHLALLLILLPCLGFAQPPERAPKKFTISGYIEDAVSGEKLIAANLFDDLSKEGAVTNTYGFFSLTLSAGEVDLSASYIGYQSLGTRFSLQKDTTITFQLSSSLELKEVEIIGKKFDRIEESSQMSKVEVPVETIERIPALLGEVDVLKALQLLPGIQSGGEGQSGIYVRGGSPDQNLILLDGVPVYNVSHLLGFSRSLIPMPLKM